jgi:hypothetical protein
MARVMNPRDLAGNRRGSIKGLTAKNRPFRVWRLHVQTSNDIIPPSMLAVTGNRNGPRAARHECLLC